MSSSSGEGRPLLDVKRTDEDVDNSSEQQQKSPLLFGFLARQGRGARGRHGVRLQLLTWVLVPLRLPGVLMGWVSLAFHLTDVSLLVLCSVAAWLHNRSLLLLFVGIQLPFLAAGLLQFVEWVLVLARGNLPQAFFIKVPRSAAVALVSIELLSLVGTFVLIVFALRFRSLLASKNLLRRLKSKYGRRNPAVLPSPEKQQALLAAKDNQESWRAFIFDETTVAQPPPACFSVSPVPVAQPNILPYTVDNHNNDDDDDDDDDLFAWH